MVIATFFMQSEFAFIFFAVNTFLQRSLISESEKNIELQRFSFLSAKKMRKSLTSVTGEKRNHSREVSITVHLYHAKLIQNAVGKRENRFSFCCETQTRGKINFLLRARDRKLVAVLCAIGLFSQCVQRRPVEAECALLVENGDYR